LSGWYKLKYTFWVPCLCSNCRPNPPSANPMVRARSSSLGAGDSLPAALDLAITTTRPGKPLPAVPKRPSPRTTTPPPVSIPTSTTPPSFTPPTTGAPPALPSRQLPPRNTSNLSDAHPVIPERTERQQLFKKAFTVFELQGSSTQPRDIPPPTTVITPKRPPTVSIPSNGGHAHEAPARLSTHPAGGKPAPPPRDGPPSTNGIITPSRLPRESPTPASIASAPSRGSLSPFQPPPASGKQVVRSATHSTLQVSPSHANNISRAITPPPGSLRPSTPPTLPTSLEAKAPPRPIPAPPQKSTAPPPRPPPPPPVPARAKVKGPPLIIPKVQLLSPAPARRSSDTPPPTRPRTRSLGEDDAPPMITVSNERDALKKDRAASPTPSHSSSFAKKRNLVSRFLSTSVVDVQTNIAEAEKVPIFHLFLFLCFHLPFIVV
jgi:hypothetical protein